MKRVSSIFCPITWGGPHLYWHEPAPLQLLPTLPIQLLPLQLQHRDSRRAPSSPAQ